MEDCLRRMLSIYKLIEDEYPLITTVNELIDELELIEKDSSINRAGTIKVLLQIDHKLKNLSQLSESNDVLILEGNNYFLNNSCHSKHIEEYNKNISTYLFYDFLQTLKANYRDKQVKIKTSHHYESIQFILLQHSSTDDIHIILSVHE